MDLDRRPELKRERETERESVKNFEMKSVSIVIEMQVAF